MNLLKDLTWSGWWHAVTQPFIEHRWLLVGLLVLIALLVGAAAGDLGTDEEGPILSEEDREHAREDPRLRRPLAPAPDRRAPGLP